MKVHDIEKIIDTATAPGTMSPSAAIDFMEELIDVLKMKLESLRCDDGE